MTKLSGVQFADVRDHSVKWWMWNHITTHFNKGGSRVVVMPRLLAVFDEGTIARFEGAYFYPEDSYWRSDGHDVHTTYKLAENVLFARGDRIEVRPFAFEQISADVRPAASGRGTFHHFRVDTKTSFALVLFDHTGRMTQLADPHHNDEVRVSNMAVELRAVLEEILGNDPVTRVHGGDLDGFSL